MRKNQSGYSLAEIIAFIVLVLLFAGLAFYIWTVRKDADKTDSVDTAQTSSEITSFKECAEAGNPVSMSFPEQCSANGKSFTNTEQTAPVAPEVPATSPSSEPTDAQRDADVKIAVIAYCKDLGTTNTTYVSNTVDANMKQANLYVRSGGFARISIGCAEGEGGFRLFLKEEANKVWRVLGGGQMETISCEALDGSGMPKAVVGTCYDKDGELRAIKA